MSAAAQRYTAEAKGSLEIYGKYGFVTISVKNISSTGVCIEGHLRKYLHKGDFVRLKLVLNKINKTHNLNAEVVWLKDNRGGLNFIKSEDLFEKMMDRKR